MTAEEETFATTINWPDLSTMPAALVNMFVVQPGAPLETGAEEPLLYLTMGHLSPPVILGDGEERRRAIERLGGELSVLPIARVVMSRDRALELHRLLTGFIERGNGGGTQSGAS